MRQTCVLIGLATWLLAGAAVRDAAAACPHFVVLANWNNAAVLDRDTGLSPGHPSVGVQLNSR